MLEVLVEERNVAKELGEDCFVQYYILSEEAEADGAMLCESYGIRIAVSGANRTQSESVRHITMRASVIDQLVHKMAEYLVTPAALRDVIEDWMAAK